MSQTSLRFNPVTRSPSGLTQLIFFYSNDQGGLLADTGVPSGLYDNRVTIQESQSGPTTYTPTAGQPGFSTDSPLGDSFLMFSTPESGSTLLMFVGQRRFPLACPAQDFGGGKLNPAMFSEVLRVMPSTLRMRGACRYIGAISSLRTTEETGRSLLLSISRLG